MNRGTQKKWGLHDKVYEDDISIYLYISITIYLYISISIYRLGYNYTRMCVSKSEGTWVLFQLHGSAMSENIGENG